MPSFPQSTANNLCCPLRSVLKEQLTLKPKKNSSLIVYWSLVYPKVKMLPSRGVLIQYKFFSDWVTIQSNDIHIPTPNFLKPKPPKRNATPNPKEIPLFITSPCFTSPSLKSNLLRYAIIAEIKL